MVLLQQHRSPFDVALLRYVRKQAASSKNDKYKQANGKMKTGSDLLLCLFIHPRRRSTECDFILNTHIHTNKLSHIIHTNKLVISHLNRYTSCQLYCYNLSMPGYPKVKLHGLEVVSLPSSNRASSATNRDALLTKGEPV